MKYRPDPVCQQCKNALRGGIWRSSLFVCAVTVFACGGARAAVDRLGSLLLSRADPLSAGILSDALVFLLALPLTAVAYLTVRNAVSGQISARSPLPFRALYGWGGVMLGLVLAGALLLICGMRGATFFLHTEAARGSFALSALGCLTIVFAALFGAGCLALTACRFLPAFDFLLCRDLPLRQALRLSYRASAADLCHCLAAAGHGIFWWALTVISCGFAGLYGLPFCLTFAACTFAPMQLPEPESVPKTTTDMVCRS